jgi:hypothetical protein
MTAKDLKLDYFQIYDVVNKPAAGIVQVRGQFDVRPQKMQLALLDFFANPVANNGESLYDSDAHLAWYRGIQPPEPMRAVNLENQFGKLKIRTGTGNGLLVPTQKVEQGFRFPETLDHYKVYRLTYVEKVPEAALKLRDQFGASDVRLQVPLFLAVPVAKRHGTKQFPIQNERVHLLICSMTARDIEKKVTLRNQFDKRPSVWTVRSVMLAVPGITLDWKPA